ncbi:hypothetical protein VYU27_010548, partial [Nannochloropsis oceanica]
RDEHKCYKKAACRRAKGTGAAVVAAAAAGGEGAQASVRLTLPRSIPAKAPSSPWHYLPSPIHDTRDMAVPPPPSSSSSSTPSLATESVSPPSALGDAKGLHRRRGTHLLPTPLTSANPLGFRCFLLFILVLLSIGGTQAFRLAAALRSLTITAAKRGGLEGGAGMAAGCYQYNTIRMLGGTAVHGRSSSSSSSSSSGGGGASSLPSSSPSSPPSSSTSSLFASGRASTVREEEEERQEEQEEDEEKEEDGAREEREEEEERREAREVPYGGGEQDGEEGGPIPTEE